MAAIRVVLLGLSLVALPRIFRAQQSESPGPEPSAEAIMARVAANQDRAEAERSRYIYVQHARVVSRKGETILCEEVTDSRVTPSATGSQQKLLKLDGRTLRKHQYVTYTTLPPARNVVDDDIDIEIGDDDRNLVESLRSGLINSKSQDGISSDLFPLTSKNQAGHAFHFVGREHTNGRDVFHIQFLPKRKDDFGWKGDAYIDTGAYQPVVISTAMARKIPFAVRTLLGTNVPGLGFTITYTSLPDGVWFPASFGTEFKIHLLFFYTREITINVQNGGFEKTQVTSDIVGVEESH
jgi:hypothetical protein